MNDLKKRVDAFIRRLEREDVCMHGFMLSKGGRLLAKAYYCPFKEGEPHRLYSVSKTMTALAIGLLLDEGRLKLNDRIADYFKDWLNEKPDPRFLRLKIEDMLCMSSCFMRTAFNSARDFNFAKGAVCATPTHEPGSVFYYDTGASQLLAELVYRLTGKQAIDLLNERVFAPLGLKDERYWLADPSGTCQGGSGLCMSLRDMHRVAEAIMNGGEGVLPKWFCEQMCQKHIETVLNQNEEERYGYCWQCWRTRAGWAMYGMGGQLAVCCPDKGCILSTIADTRLDPFGVQRIYNAFFEEIYPYIDKEDMECESYSLSIAPLKDDPTIPFEHTQTYVFNENGMGIKALRLTNEGLEITGASGTSVLEFTFGQNTLTRFPGTGRAALCSAGRLSENLLRIRCFIIDDAPCGIDMVLAFKENSLTLSSRKSFDPDTDRYEGVISSIAVMPRRGVT